MIWKNKISKKEYREIIDEILGCEKAIKQHFNVYAANSISRLVMARVKLETSEIDESFVDETTKEESV